MFGLFSPRCPVRPRERVWVERGIARLLEVLGPEWLRRTPVLTLDDLQDVLAQQPVAAADVARRLEPQFPYPLEGIEWVEEPDLQGEQKAHYVLGPTPLGVVPHHITETPELRTAHIVRCLCQHVLATRDEFGPLDRQPTLAADLLAVLTGTGLFPANSTIQEKYSLVSGVDSWLHTRQPFMPSRLFGYAFAVRCRLCEEPAAQWAFDLRLDAREPFELGQKFLRKRSPVVWDDARDTMRSFLTPPSLDDVIRRLRHREAAVQINAMYDVVEFGLSDSSVLHELAGLVHDHDDQVLEELIRTIARLDTGTAEMGETLIILCDDSNPAVRTLAAFALGEIQQPPPDAVESLRELTKDSEPSVCAAAAESLLRFPEGLADEHPRLFRVLRQQLARCDYDRVDRFMHRLHAHAGNADQLIANEFSSTEDETWRQLLQQSLAGIRAETATAPGA